MCRIVPFYLAYLPELCFSTGSLIHRTQARPLLEANILAKFSQRSRVSYSSASHCADISFPYATQDCACKEPFIAMTEVPDRADAASFTYQVIKTKDRCSVILLQIVKDELVHYVVIISLSPL
jgi:hypothetical protein